MKSASLLACGFFGLATPASALTYSDWARAPLSFQHGYVLGRRGGTSWTARSALSLPHCFAGRCFGFLLLFAGREAFARA